MSASLAYAEFVKNGTQVGIIRRIIDYDKDECARNLELFDSTLLIMLVTD
jgi:hypothetical protein